MRSHLVNLVALGIALGAISVLIGIIAKFLGGMLWTVSAQAYLRFAQTCFLGTIALGVWGVLQPKKS